MQNESPPPSFSFLGMDVRMWGATLSAFIFAIVLLVLCLAMAETGSERCLNVTVLVMALGNNVK